MQIYKTCRIFCGSNNGRIVTFGWITSLTFYLIYFFKAEVSLSSLGFSPLFPEACLWSGRSGAPAVKPSEEMIHFFLHTQQDGPVFKGMEIQQLWCVILLIFFLIQCKNLVLKHFSLRIYGIFTAKCAVSDFWDTVDI